MLIKMWAFALVLALAAIPVTSSLAAGSDPAGAGPRPEENNATAGTAAAGSNTPSGKSIRQSLWNYFRCSLLLRDPWCELNSAT